MSEESDIWQRYYQKALLKKHHQRCEFALKLNLSASRVAIDCGCGTGADIAFLAESGYDVHGFDINEQAITICRERFSSTSNISLSQTSFEQFTYPSAGIVIANDSLFFADKKQFWRTWQNIELCLEQGGVFAGDFLGNRDSWAKMGRSDINPLSEPQVEALFDQFEIIRRQERDEKGVTMLGREKHWHTFSIVARKK